MDIDYLMLPPPPLLSHLDCGGLVAVLASSCFAVDVMTD